MSLCYASVTVLLMVYFTSNDTLNLNSFKGVDDFN